MCVCVCVYVCVLTVYRVFVTVFAARGKQDVFYDWIDLCTVCIESFHPLSDQDLTLMCLSNSVPIFHIYFIYIPHNTNIILLSNSNFCACCL